MKRLLLLFVIISIGIVTMAQPVLYKCNAIHSRDIDATTMTYSTQWNTIDTDAFIIEVDLENISVKINNDQNSRYYLRGQFKNEKGVDIEGDKYTLSMFKAIDEEGIGCEFALQEYTNINFVRFIVSYNDVQVVWTSERLD